MEKQFLYVVDHFVPFPSSEYGGLWVVIAKNDNECFDLISESDEEENSNHYSTLKKNIINARVFELFDNEESRIVEQFIT